MKACSKGTLAVRFSDRLALGALLCRSWNCPSCRKKESAKLLDRLRRGMESRPEMNRILLTLTTDPSKFDAIRIGTAYWDANNNRVRKSQAQRFTTLWSSPTLGAFQEAAERMSIEWRKLNDRLKSKAKRAKVEAPGYFRVIELHRNGWPHYHVVIEHPTWTAADIETQVRAWGLGTQVDMSDLSLDDAIGEVAPYLTSAEKKSNGSKAYQFAASALPEGFRLHSSSQGFLAAPREAEEVPEHAIPLKGRPVEHAKPLREFGAKTALVLPTSQERPPRYRPRSLVAWGDGAKLYYLNRMQETTGTHLAVSCSDAPPLEVDLEDLPY